MKLESHESVTPLAFGCFYDIKILVRRALDEIVPQLPVSNCLLVFRNTNYRMCKEVISQPTIFHILKTDPEATTFLDKTLFLQNPYLRSCCLFGEQIPASWIRQEVLLEICSDLGENDSFSELQLENLNRLIKDNPQTISLKENDSYECRLNQLLEILVDWRDGAEDPPVGQLFASLESVGLLTIVESIEESLPIFVLNDPSEYVG